jgi:hypothetical protein
MAGVRDLDYAVELSRRECFRPRSRTFDSSPALQCWG